MREKEGATKSSEEDAPLQEDKRWETEEKCGSWCRTSDATPDLLLPSGL